MKLDHFLFDTRKIKTRLGRYFSRVYEWKFVVDLIEKHDSQVFSSICFSYQAESKICHINLILKPNNVYKIYVNTNDKLLQVVTEKVKGKNSNIKFLGPQEFFLQNNGVLLSKILTRQHLKHLSCILGKVGSSVLFRITKNTSELFPQRNRVFS